MNKPNRLIHETSPYLLQHANNPVDWYPWGIEALTKAKNENRPILLSIGYTACHWCHVMEHESFENEMIAKLMNESFISIKVDREERPDLDQIYQNVAQILTHSGGWPLTVFLTPDQKPFFGGTYFPPTSRYGRPGFADILFSISKVWKESPEDIEHNCKHLISSIEQLQSQDDLKTADTSLKCDRKFLDEIGNQILKNIDTIHGGFGSHPKFPHTSSLSFLLRWGNSTVNEKALNAVTFSLEKMARGGIFDQLAGGFHRYTVEDTWLIPHFEKMLYDNALLLKLYSEALLTTQLSPQQTNLFIEIIEKTILFCVNELKNSEAGFYSSLDADSLNTEGHSEEGFFYTWKYEELKAFLSPEEFNCFVRFYSVTATGNFENSSTILTQNNHKKIDEVHLLESAIKKCLKERALRKRPTCDDKIITSWNGLMISGLAWASSALKKINPKLSELAKKTAENTYLYIEENLTDKNNRLKTSIKNKIIKGHGYLDDYAYMIQASFDLARITNSNTSAEKYINSAKQWATICIAQYYDNENGFYFTAKDQEELILRPKSIWDQSIPSATAVMIQNLRILAEFENDTNYFEYSEALLKKNLQNLKAYPLGMSELANACILSCISPVLLTGNYCPDNPYFFKKSSESKEITLCHRFKCTNISAIDDKTLLSIINLN